MAGWAVGVGALEDDLALAVWLHRIGEHDHALRVGRQPPGRVVEVLVRVDAQAPLPDVGVVPTGEEADLCVVAVVVAEAGGEPGARIVERRGDEAAPSRRPLGDASLGLLLQRLKFGGHRRVVPGIRGQRPGRGAQGIGAKRDADLVHRDAGPWRGEEEGDLEVVLQVLADMRRIDLTRDARRLELAPRPDAGQQEQVRRPDRAAAQHDLPGGKRRARFAALRCGTRRPLPPCAPASPQGPRA